MGSEQHRWGMLRIAHIIHGLEGFVNNANYIWGCGVIVKKGAISKA